MNAVTIVMVAVLGLGSGRAVAGDTFSHQGRSAGVQIKIGGDQASLLHQAWLRAVPLRPALAPASIATEWVGRSKAL